MTWKEHTRSKQSRGRSLRGRSFALMALASLTALSFMAPPLSADPPAWEVTEDPGGQGGPEASMRSLLRESNRLHMELGRYYMMTGLYDIAIDHFLAIATLDVPEEALSERPRAAARLKHGQARAFLMAALSTQLLGQTEDAVELALAGQALLADLPEREPRAGRHRSGEPGDGSELRSDGADDDQRRRGRARHRRGNRQGPRHVAQSIERFLEDPAAAAQRFSDGVSGLEQRVLEIDAQLGNNGG